MTYSCSECLRKDNLNLDGVLGKGRKRARNRWEKFVSRVSLFPRALAIQVSECIIHYHAWKRTRVVFASFFVVVVNVSVLWWFVRLNFTAQ